MIPKFTAHEARVIGCLMEKSVVTPDQYPLTLNALTSACNQKTSRNPVMKLDPGIVQRTVRGLEEKALVHIEENFRRGVEKYAQRFCNTRLADYKFDPPQFAIVCVLLLRGPRTPGELRANSGRLHTFADNRAVADALRGLMERDGDPLVVKLPRTKGRKDSEYMHVFCGPVDVAEPSLERATRSPPAAPRPSSGADLAARVAALEEELAALKRRLGED